MAGALHAYPQNIRTSQITSVNTPSHSLDSQLGGFLGRKSGEEPGIVAVWRGWQRLQDFTATWKLIVDEHTLFVGNR